MVLVALFFSLSRLPYLRQLKVAKLMQWSTLLRRELMSTSEMKVGYVEWNMITRACEDWDQ